METRKSIAYAYPSSTNAELLGMGTTGCWHIQLEYVDIEGSGQNNVFVPHDAEGFETPNDPDLIALFHEYEGTICPYFAKYGNALALAVINK